MLAFPVYTVLLTLYIMHVWKAAGKAISRGAEQTIDSMGSGDLVKIIAFALLLPVVVGLVVSWWMAATDVTAATVEQYYAALPDFHAGWYLFGILLAL